MNLGLTGQPVNIVKLSNVEPLTGWSRTQLNSQQSCWTQSGIGSTSDEQPSRMALSTWKREPRQTGNGATVARKGVTGPFPISGCRVGQHDSHGAGRIFPVLKRIGNKAHAPRTRRFSLGRVCFFQALARARFGNVYINAAGGVSRESSKSRGRRLRRDELLATSPGGVDDVDRVKLPEHRCALASMRRAPAFDRERPVMLPPHRGRQFIRGSHSPRAESVPRRWPRTSSY